MKILLVSFYYYPELGAAPSRITNMASGLREQGAEVDVLTCMPNYPKGKIFEGYRGTLYKKEKNGGNNIYRYWTYATISKNPISRAWGMLSFAIMMWFFALRVKLVKSYDRVIVQSPPLLVSFSAVVIFKCLYKKIVVLNVSDLWPLSAVELGAISNVGLSYKIFAWIEKFIYKKVNGIIGQSEEILKHISDFDSSESKILYRNLQNYTISAEYKERNPQLKIVYAGLLGVAQDILGIIKNVNFKELDVELHLYGGGYQTKEIEAYIDNKEMNVFYHGYVNKNEIVKELSKYDASIIPLAVQIKGAVPSKIYDILPVGIPVLFCGGGEGAQIIKRYDVGYISDPGDYKSLKDNIEMLKNISSEEYIELSKRCIYVSRNEFNFNEQMIRTKKFLEEVN